MAVAPAAKVFYAALEEAVGAAIGRAVIMTAISYGLHALTKGLFGSNGNGTTGNTKAREVLLKGAAEYQQIILGEVKTSGVVVFYGVAGQNNSKLYYVIAHAGHQCEAIGDIYINETLVPASAINGSTGAVSLNDFMDSGSSYLYIWKHTGAHNQAANSDLVAYVNNWTTDHRGAGICMTVVACIAQSRIWATGAPTSIAAIVKGARLYDPRLDSTNGGSGSHRYTDATTWAWSDNSALALRWYLTGGSKFHSQATPLALMGLGESNTRLDSSYDIAAANACDEVLSGTSGLGLLLVPETRLESITGSGATRTAAYSQTSQYTGILALYHKVYCPTTQSTFDFSVVCTGGGAQVGLASAVSALGMNSANGGYQLDYAFGFGYGTSNGCAILEVAGVTTPAQTIGTFTGSTVLRMVYDGSTIKYYKDGALQRTTSAAVGNMYLVIILATFGSSVTVTLNTNSTEKRFTCNTQLSCGESHKGNIETILSSMLGEVVPVNGKLRMYAGVYDTPTVTLDENDVVGDLDISTVQPRESQWNAVSGTFYDENRNWQRVTYPTRTQSSYQTADGEYLEKTLDLPATRGVYRAQRIANVKLNQGRNKLVLKFSALSMKALSIARHQTFYLNLPEFTYSNLVLRCKEWSFPPSGFPSMTAQVESAATYADLAATDYADPVSTAVANSALQLPDAPTGLAAVASPGAISFYVTTTLVNDETIELWESTSSSPFSSATKINEGNQAAFTAYKTDTTTRYYWVRKRKNGQVSDTYPASTGTGAAAIKVGTDQMAADAVTEYYSATGGAAGSVANNTLLLTISLTPTRSGNLDVSLAVEGSANFTADSGTSCSARLYQGGSLISSFTGVGWDAGLIRTTSTGFGTIAVTGGVAYEVRLYALKSFGTLNIYNTIMTALVRKR